MVLQPCDRCGRWVNVERKLWISWSKEIEDEDKVFCLKCKCDIRKSILKK